MKIKYMVVWSTDPNRDDACSGYGDFVRVSDARNYARMIERDIPGAKVTLNQSVSGLTLATAEAEGRAAYDQAVGDEPTPAQAGKDVL
jgi:hypothetical protein